MNKRTYFSRIAGGALTILLCMGASGASANTLKVYFARVDGSVTNIYSMLPTVGATPTLITAGTTPNFSKDGTKMVFSRANGLYLSAPDGTGLTQITLVAGDVSPSFADDGTSIVYISGGKVATIKPDGTGKTTLTSGTADRTPRFNHAGDTVYFARSGTLYSVSSSGGTATMEGSANTLSLSSIAVRQDDTALIYSRSGGVRGLYRYTINGTTSALGASINGDGYPAFSPDETQFVFSSTSTAAGRAAVGGTGDLFLANIDSSNNLTGIVNLTNSAANEFAPVLASVATTGTPVPATTGALVSQFRLGGPGGATDEFIELANTTNAPLLVTGWSLVAGGVTVPITGTIPANGHLLLTNSGGYSLSVLGDATYTGDIATNATLLLKNATGTTVDTVGNLSATAAPTSATAQYAYIRRLESGAPSNTGTAATDWNLVDTASLNSTTDRTGVGPITGARLGSPSPHNAASTVQNNAQLPNGALSIPGVYPIARYVSKGSAIDSKGRLTIRRTITNNTGAAVSKLRFRVTAITAGGSTTTGVADLRALSSGGVKYFDSHNMLQQAAVGLPLDAPTTPTEAPLTPTSAGNGGGLNAGWTAPLPGGTLAAGASISVEFLFGIQAEGKYRVLVDAELLP